MNEKLEIVSNGQEEEHVRDENLAVSSTTDAKEKGEGGREDPVLSPRRVKARTQTENNTPKAKRIQFRIEPWTFQFVLSKIKTEANRVGFRFIFVVC